MSNHVFNYKSIHYGEYIDNGLIDNNYNNTDVILINFNKFLRAYERGNRLKYVRSENDEYGTTIGLSGSYVENDILSLIYRDLSRVLNLDVNINNIVLNRLFWHKEDYDKDFFHIIFLDYNEKVKKELIREISNNRIELRKRLFTKYYNQILMCLLHCIFEDNDIKSLSGFKFKIYNYHPIGVEYIKTKYPIYLDDNYKVNKLTNKSTYTDFINMFNPLNLKILEDDLIVDLYELTNSLLLFIEMYNSVTDKLLFRICKHSYINDRVKKLENVFNDIKDISTENQLEELKFFSGLDFEKVLEVNNSKFNFDV